MFVRNVRPTGSTLFRYCPVYLVIMICNQRKLISHTAKKMGCQFQDKTRIKTYRLRQNLNLKSKITNYNFYPYPSDTIKHSLESSKPENFRLILNVLLVQLSKLFGRIYNSTLSWLCEICYLTQKCRLSVRHFFLIL